MIMLKKIIRLNLDDLWLACGAVAAVFLLLEGIIGGVLWFTDTNSCPMVAGTLLPFVSAFLIVCFSVSHINVTFQQAIRFGQTRRRSLGLYLGLVGFEGLCSMATALVLSLAEQFLAPTLWLKLTGLSNLAWGMDGSMVPEGMEPTADQASTLFVEGFTLAWYWWVVLSLGAITLGTIVGTLYLRFGRKAAWISWGVWMAICFLPQLLPESVLAQLPRMLPLAAVAAVAGLVWSVWHMLHCVVRN